MPATKEQIADTFERHAERYGYARASVEDVAAELGISKRTVYQHFSSKRDIYAFVIERIAEASRLEMRRVVAAVPSWGEKVEVLMRFVLAGSRAHIAETSKTDWQQEYEVAGAAFMKAVGDVMREVIGGGIASGEFALPDAVIAEKLVAAMSLEYVMLVREDPSLDVDESLAGAVRRFLG